MSSQIPPLVCHTPPPIDFDTVDDDDEYGSDIPEDDGIANDDCNESTCPDDDFGEFTTVLPRGTTVEPNTTEAVIDNETENLTSIPASAETKGVFPTRLGSDSPPSLILPPNEYTEGDGDETVAEREEDEDEDIDYQPFGCPSQPPEPPPEDSISLPSLHFDADVSKSEEDDNVPVQPNPASSMSGSGVPETEVDHLAAAAAERTTPVIQEGGRFDDNTENDFTDFTTASNERSSVVLEIPTANDVSFELDDFAQLESTPSADSNFVSQQSRTDFATFDADFSKFDSFQASFPVALDEAAQAKTPIDESKALAPIEQTPVKQLTEPQIPADDFDDFQEFATFSEQPTATISSQPSLSANRIDVEPTLQASTIAMDDGKKYVLSSTETADGDSEDDDFGEFSDFKQPETVNNTFTPICSFSMENVQNLLELMFPYNASEPLATDTGQRTDGDNIPSNTLHSQLQDFDNTCALTYQYSKSSSSKTLVTALGIDSRNIMHGPKWNSSMPRFAANLSFDPLEPLKPTVPTSKEASANVNEKNTNFATIGKPATLTSSGLEALQTSVVAGSSVPAAQFDWNSSGLVNPLEGVQEMLQKATVGQPEDGPKGEVLDSQISENPSPIAADDIAVVRSSIVTPSAVPSRVLEDEDVGSLDFASGNSSIIPDAAVLPSTIPEHQQQQVGPTQSHPYASHQQTQHPQQQQQQLSMSISSSPNSVPVVRTIKLPETHIFTPSRGVTPVSRDITDRDIVVREYHDVEYSLEKSRGAAASKSDPDLEEFNDFQSVFDHPSVAPASSVAIDSHSSIRPVIGRSPTEELEQRMQDGLGHASNGRTVECVDTNEDDDFSDFQAAIPSATVVQPVNKPVSNVQNNRSNTNSPVMLLSPAILLPQQANAPMEKDSPTSCKNAPAALINWPEPGIDPDEMARFEAAFAKPAAQSSSPATTIAASNQSVQVVSKAPAVEEDEWTDFISSKPVAVNEASIPPAGSTQAAPESVSGTQEEWTDFISSSSTSGASGGFTSHHNRLSSSQNNFNFPGAPSAGRGYSSSGTKAPSTWSNQPQMPPPQFNSWNSNSLYYNPMAALPLTAQRPSAQYVPPRQQHFYNRSEIPVTAFASGAGFSGVPKVPTNPQHHHASAGPGGGPMMMGQQPAMQLLPELSFITPNVAGHGGGTPGAKPATHSFLSNVISSNTFTKK